MQSNFVNQSTGTDTVYPSKQILQTSARYENTDEYIPDTVREDREDTARGQEFIDNRLKMIETKQYFGPEQQRLERAYQIRNSTKGANINQISI